MSGKVSNRTNDKHLNNLDLNTDQLEANQTNGNSIVQVTGNTVGDGSGDKKHLHLDGSGNLQSNVVNTVNVAPANSVNSHITNDPANSFAVGLKGRTTIGDATTELFLLSDASGHLQVDVNSSALPTGAASEVTLSAAEVHLGNIDGNITACDTGNITVSSSVLPTGAASETTLSAAEVHLGNIDGNITACNTGNVTISSSALPTGAASETTLSAAEVHLGNIEGIVKEEDTAHSSGDKGVMLLGVRQSTQADFGADGDYVPISINDDGEIRVTSSGGGGGGGDATAANQASMISELQDIETQVTNTNTKLDTIDSVLDNILVKNTEIDNAVDSMSAKLPASLGQKANASSLSICRSSTTGAFDLSGRTAIATSSTSTKLLCDTSGRLEVNNRPKQLQDKQTTTHAGAAGTFHYGDWIDTQNYNYVTFSITNNQLNATDAAQVWWSNSNGGAGVGDFVGYNSGAGWQTNALVFFQNYSADSSSNQVYTVDISKTANKARYFRIEYYYAGGSAPTYNMYYQLFN